MSVFKKSLTLRAAEAVKKGSSSAELLSIKAEVTSRIKQVDVELSAKRQGIDNALNSGDPDAVKEARQAFDDLKDEDTMLHRQQFDLAQAITTAKGEEAVKATDQLRKSMSDAVQKALKAQAMLAECEAIGRQLCQARRDAAGIGKQIVFNADAIRSLAGAVYPEGSSQQKQLMIDLGIRESIRAA